MKQNKKHPKGVRCENQQPRENKQPEKEPIIIILAKTKNASLFCKADSETATVDITLNTLDCTRERVMEEVDRVFDQMLINCKAL